MSPTGPTIDIQFTPQSIIEGFRKIDRARQDMEKGVAGAAEKWDKAFTDFSQQIVTVSNRASQAQERHIRNIERQAEAYGKTGIERQIGLIDQEIKRYQDDESAVNRLTAAKEKLSAANQVAGQGMGQVNDQMRQAKTSAALLGQEFGVHIPRQLRGFIAELPGVGAALSGAFSGLAVIGLVEVVVSAIQKIAQLVQEMEKLRQAPERIAGEMGRFNDSLRISNEELAVSNDRLENTVARLEHKPENAIKLALDETALAADHFAERMDKALGQLAEIAEKNRASFFARLFGNQADFEDIVKRIQGESGFGGYRAELRGAKGSPEAQLAILRRERERVEKEIQSNPPVTGEGFLRGAVGYAVGGVQGGIAGLIGNTQARLEVLRGQLEALSEQTKGIDEESKRVALEKEAATAREVDFTHKLQAEVERAQQGELSGIDKINDAHRQRIEQLIEEGHYSQQNVELVDKLRDAETKRFQQEEQRKISRATFESGTAIGAQRVRSEHEIFQARRRAAGEEFGEADIQEQYDFTKKAAQEQLDRALHHVQELREARATDADIRVATEAATTAFVIASNEAETRRIVEGIDLRTRKRKEAENEIRAEYERSRSLQDAIAQEQDRREHDQLQRRIQMVQALNVGGSASEQAETFRTIEGLRTEAAQLQYTQATARIGRERTAAEALPSRTPDERIRQADALNKLTIEGIKAEGDLQRQIDDAHMDSTIKVLELQKKQFEEIKGQIEPLYQTLFTHPDKFGKQLQKTVQEAALKPIVGGVSELTARALYPVMYGATGTGGIASVVHGMFGGGGGGRLSDIKLTQSGLVPVSIQEVSVSGGGGGGGVGGMLGDLGERDTLTSRQAAGFGAQFRRYITGGQQFPAAFQQASQATGVDQSLLRAVAQTESSMRPGAVSPAGAMGLMQLMPSTMKDWGVTQPFSPEQNVMGGAEQLQTLLTRYHGDATAALAAYNMGPAAYDRAVAKGQALPQETQNYIQRVTQSMKAATAPAPVYGPIAPTPVYGPIAPTPAYAGAAGAGAAPLVIPSGSLFAPWSAIGAPAGATGMMADQMNVRGQANAAAADITAASTMFARLFGGSPGTAAAGRGFNAMGMTGLGKNLVTNWKAMIGMGQGASTTPAATAQWGQTPGQQSLDTAAGGSGFSWSGFANSPLAKGGAMTGGMMLAQAGLLGENRGTAGGMVEGMFGGAGVGFAIGGPLGAGIGAAAGLGIGLGEMLAGVESPRHQAIRLAKQLYGIGINNATADQIVAIANQSYAGQVGTAVRSPQVRQMLGLYAAGTGQAGQYKMGLDQPHGASLVESGGTLYQQATYQYGNAYTYNSSLPVYGGSPGQPTHNLGAPGGNLSLSLNIGGSDAASFMTGQVVTPDVVQSQYASAMYGSTGRVNQALLMQSPGSVVA